MRQRVRTDLHTHAVYRPDLMIGNLLRVRMVEGDVKRSVEPMRGQELRNTKIRAVPVIPARRYENPLHNAEPTPQPARRLAVPLQPFGLEESYPVHSHF